MFAFWDTSNRRSLRSSKDVYKRQLVAYLTVSSALPSWMPLGGAVVAAGAYNAVARPVAVRCV